VVGNSDASATVTISIRQRPGSNGWDVAHEAAHISPSSGGPEEAMPAMAACSNHLRGAHRVRRHARPRPREIAGNRAPCAHLSQNRQLGIPFRVRQQFRRPAERLGSGPPERSDRAGLRSSVRLWRCVCLTRIEWPEGRGSERGPCNWRFWPHWSCLSRSRYLPIRLACEDPLKLTLFERLTNCGSYPESPRAGIRSSICRLCKN